MIRFPFLLLALLGVPALIQAQDDDHAAHEKHSDKARSLGHVSFPNSGNAAAQKPFLEGVALIHSFEYEDAVEAFHRAENADSGFALPYWMEALTNTQLIWGIDDTASAHAVLNRLAPTASERLARARNARERAFGAAVEAFYSNRKQEERVQAFADSLRHWSQRMPADPEAHASGTPVHVHPRATESYDVVEGRLDVFIDGGWKTLSRGETASVPPGVAHTFRNPDAAVSRVRNTHAPAMRFGEYFGTIHRIVESGYVAHDRMTLKAMLYLAAVMQSQSPRTIRKRNGCSGQRCRQSAGWAMGLKQCVKP